MTAENITGHKFCRRHILERSVREYFSCHLSLSKFQKESVLKHVADPTNRRQIDESHKLLGCTAF